LISTVSKRRPNDGGNVYQDRTGRWYARISYAPKERRSFRLPDGLTPPEADHRGILLADTAKRLRAAAIEPSMIVYVLAKHRRCDRG
jgi:hypothetical protein